MIMLKTEKQQGRLGSHSELHHLGYLEPVASFPGLFRNQYPSIIMEARPFRIA